MSADVLVVGGGLIGLASAWRAAQRGLTVTVLDDAPGSGASRVAAGMLAPVTEVHYGEEALLRLAISSGERWPRFAEELEAVSGTDIGFRPDGTLLVAFDADDRRVLEDLRRFMGELGLDVESLRSRACRLREPMLSPRIRGGVLAAHDHRVDPRLVLAALLRACEDAGVEVRRDRVAGIDHDGMSVRGVSLHDGTALPAPAVVLAAGTGSTQVTGIPEDLRPPVRPVKGQVLRLRSTDGEPLLGVAVRGLVRGRSVYLVPRDDGELVVGATQEERGHDLTVTGGGVRTLLDDAARIVPGVDELELVEMEAGLRPGTPDNRPLIGPTRIDGLVLATGHFRNGVLLTPLTADTVAAHLAGQPADPVTAVAAPDRELAGAGTSGREDQGGAP